MRVMSENVRTGETDHVSTAYLTMVALDDQGRPAEVPPLDAGARRTRSAGPGRPSSAATTGSRSEPGSRRSAPASAMISAAATVARSAWSCSWAER